MVRTVTSAATAPTSDACPNALPRDVEAVAPLAVLRQERPGLGAAHFEELRELQPYARLERREQRRCVHQVHHEPPRQELEERVAERRVALRQRVELLLLDAERNHRRLRADVPPLTTNH